LICYYISIHYFSTLQIVYLDLLLQYILIFLTLLLVDIFFMYAICVCGIVFTLKSYFSFFTVYISHLCLLHCTYVSFLYAFFMKAVCFLHHLTDSISCGCCELLWIMWNLNK
jgi:hypothetical protein